MGLVFGPCAGCLVTDEIMFDGEPNYPPVILDAIDPVVPIGWFVWIDSAEGATWDDLSVRVRDENINQDLQAHWRVLGEGETSAEFERRSLAPGVLERELKITIDRGTLDVRGCHRLELAVSGSFSKTQTAPSAFDFRPDDVQTDIDRALWWIFEGKMSSPDDHKRDVLDSCNPFDPSLPSDPLMEEP